MNVIQFMKILPTSVMVVEANLINLIPFFLKCGFSSEKIARTISGKGLPWIEAEGQIISQDAEWLEANPNRKKIQPNQIGKSSPKLDLEKIWKKKFESAFMASSASFLAKDTLKQMRIVAPYPRELRQVWVRSSQTRWDVLSPPVQPNVIMPAGLGSREASPNIDTILIRQGHLDSDGKNFGSLLIPKYMCLGYQVD